MLLLKKIAAKTIKLKSAKGTQRLESSIIGRFSIYYLKLPLVEDKKKTLFCKDILRSFYEKMLLLLDPVAKVCK